MCKFIGVLHHILLNRGDKTIVEGMVGFIEKKDYPYPPQATTSNLNPNQPCSHCNIYARDANHCCTLHPKLQQG
jgi:hypothetical protein